MNKIERNLKATSLLNISLGLYLISRFLDPIINKATNFMTYFGIGLAILLLISGIYNYFFLLKNEEIITNKKYGILSLIIGVLFIISGLMDIINLKLSISSLGIRFLSATVALILAFYLLKQDR